MSPNGRPSNPISAIGAWATCAGVNERFRDLPDTDLRGERPSLR